MENSNNLLVEGHDWWQSANDRYLTINGGLTVGLDTIYTCHCCWQQWKLLPYNEGWDSVTVCSDWQVATAGAPCTNSHPNAQCYITQSIRPRLIHHDNDGMVPAWSSGNYPGLSINYVRRVDSTYYTKQWPQDPNVAQGANHEQINNSANTKKMMNDLLNGKIHWWFKTEEY